ncbi:Os05g0592450 [Oryza sativa Japonica Group]|uniref:Os05g0592450 protein n=1 Tax=Oryza sativa subsp. japonica TaxID=39947 RepID=A0A0P0WRQ3_ORYSJ|nr:hypothetical protein EE612_031484 [Oryza sativa]BAS95640.1 Os05g0592450 [Oryza sativa Japonica Group]
MNFTRVDWSFSRNTYCSCGSEAIIPITPLMVPKITVGIWPISESGSRITSEPCRSLFTNSPRWYSPTTSSLPLSSSVAASLFFRTVKML